MVVLVLLHQLVPLDPLVPKHLVTLVVTLVDPLVVALIVLVDLEVLVPEKGFSLKFSLNFNIPFFFNIP